MDLDHLPEKDDFDIVKLKHNHFVDPPYKFSVWLVRGRAFKGKKEFYNIFETKEQAKNYISKVCVGRAYIPGIKGHLP